MHSDAKKNVHTHNIGLYFLSWKKGAGLVFFERLTKKKLESNC